MFKLGQYKLLAASLAVSAVFLAGCMQPNKSDEVANFTKKEDISGGVYYPIINDKTGPYKVNPNAHGTKFTSLKVNHGRVPTANELKAWDKDVMPDGTGLPEGEGSVELGEELYEAQCVMCHGDFGSGGGGYPALSKGNADELHETLSNNRWKDPEAEGPVRVFGSYWPQASTLWWYIRDAMPHTKSKTLSDDETYALVAYILNINEMSVDGVEVDDEYVLNREKFLKISMPNKDGFVPNIDGKDGLKNVREFYSKPENFGAIKVKESERCMKDCQKTSRVVRVQNGGISDFHPVLSTKRNLPDSKNGDSAHKVVFDAKAAYEANCTMCHGTGVAPEAGDKAGWAKFLEKGVKEVYANGINGTNMGMPARGGSSLSDDEFKEVVDFMIKL